jgi:hypothetical protein
VSRRFGDPGYAVLTPHTHRSLLSGADDGGEIGVFHPLFRAQRYANLQGVLQEYLPWGAYARLSTLTPTSTVWRHLRREEETA